MSRSGDAGRRSPSMNCGVPMALVRNASPIQRGAVMPGLKLAPMRQLHEPVAALRPSEYTAALIHVLRARAASVRNSDVLEIGSGSGVVLAALGALGAASLCGIDIESEATLSGSLLLRELGYGDNVEFHRSDMWQPVAGRRFDLIAANLPHFPMEPREIGCRLLCWR